MHGRMHYLGHEIFSTNLYAYDIRRKSQSQLEKAGQLSWHEFRTFISLSDL